jgi:chromosome segregation ATPase
MGERGTVEHLRSFVRKYEAVIEKIERTGCATVKKQVFAVGDIPEIRKKIDEFHEEINFQEELIRLMEEKARRFLSDDHLPRKVAFKLDRMKDDSDQKRIIDELIRTTSKIDDLHTLLTRLQADRCENQSVYNVAQSNYRFLTKRMKFVERKLSALERCQDGKIEEDEEEGEEEGRKEENRHQIEQHQHQHQQQQQQQQQKYNDHLRFGPSDDEMAEFARQVEEMRREAIQREDKIGKWLMDELAEEEPEPLSFSEMWPADLNPNQSSNLT